MNSKTRTRSKKKLYYETITILAACFMVHINEFLSVYNGYELLYGKNTRNCCPKLIFFVMEQVIVDQILSRTLFEKKSSGKSTQKFCNQITLPRSEIEFFFKCL